MFRKLGSDEQGATVIEFAFLAPALIILLFGVVQLALSAQSYNAMRSVASETARYAVVEYQKQTPVTDDAVQTFAKDLGTGARYQMLANLDATVDTAGTQRVDGAVEKTLTLTYTPPAVMPLVDWISPELTFTRPIFVIDE